MTPPAEHPLLRSVVVGAGQSGLATAYYLRRGGLQPGVDFIVLDAGSGPGGSWAHMWPNLRLFSPLTASSLPGWLMLPWDDSTRGYPPAQHVVSYLTRDEERYELQVQRPHRVLPSRIPTTEPNRWS